MTKVVGCSWIGYPCKRFIWLKFRDAFEEIVSKEQTLIFDEGYRIEKDVILDLKSSGVSVIDRDSHNNQIWVSSPETKWIGGFIDGILHREGEMFVLEVKSANAKNFEKIKKFGVIRAKPSYFSQLNCYLRGMNVLWGVWFVRNKDTGETYEEVLLFDEEKYKSDIMQAIDIITSEHLPEKSSNIHLCKYCHAYKVCNGMPEASHKMCKHYYVKLDDDSSGFCSKNHRKCEKTCDEFCFSNEIFENAGFNHEDEDVYYDRHEQQLVPCEIVLRDDWGHEYPVRTGKSLVDCIELKNKVNDGFSPMAKII